MDRNGVHVEGVLPIWGHQTVWTPNDKEWWWQQSDKHDSGPEIELAVAVIQGHGRDVSGMVCMAAAGVLPTPDSNRSHGDRLVAQESSADEVNMWKDARSGRLQPLYDP